MTTVRLGHVSDTHLGHRQYKKDERYEDYFTAFEHVVDTVIDEGLDALVHTGDLFHDKTPTPETLARTITILQRLNEAEIPFLAIVGNHERRRSTQWLDIAEAVGTAHVLTTEPYVVGGVALYGIGAVRRPHWAGAEFDLTEPPADVHTRVICMHELVTPPIPEFIAGQMTPEPYPAADVLEKFTTDVDAVALGDYHGRESTTVDGVDFWYAGSTERGSRDETAARSFEIVSIAPDGAITRATHTIPTRSFVDVTVDVTEGMDLAAVDAEFESRDLEDAVVKVHLTGADAGFTVQDVRDRANARGALVTDVTDARDHREDALDVDVDEHSVTDSEAVVDDHVAERDLSETAATVEEIVRDVEGVGSSAVRGRARAVLEEAAPSTDGQVAANGDAEAAPGGDDR